MGYDKITFRRQTVIAAADMLKALGHSGFDRFLLELDLGDTEAGRGSGLEGRATSLANYSFKNPDMVSPEGKTIAEEIVERASQLWEKRTMNNLQPSEREAFAKAMSREGRPLDDDVFVLGGEVQPNGWTDAAIHIPRRDVEKLRAAIMPKEPEPMTFPRKIFIVHGHDGVEDRVARFLEKLGFEAVILHEQVDGGRTVIEKLEANSDVGYAVVILTADDTGAKKGNPQKDRARQNVILEWGYFAGKLGRRHVCALKQGDIEIPSDFLGLVWKEFDAAGAWKSALAKELHAVGFDIDWQKAH